MKIALGYLSLMILIVSCHPIPQDSKEQAVFSRTGEDSSTLLWAELGKDDEDEGDGFCIFKQSTEDKGDILLTVSGSLSENQLKSVLKKQPSLLKHILGGGLIGYVVHGIKSKKLLDAITSKEKLETLKSKEMNKLIELISQITPDNRFSCDHLK